MPCTKTSSFQHNDHDDPKCVAINSVKTVVVHVAFLWVFSLFLKIRIKYRVDQGVLGMNNLTHFYL